MLADRTLRDLLTDFASPNPTPGAGGATAAAAGLGVSLLQRGAGLPKTRTGADTERAALQSASTALEPIRAGLLEAIDADAAAYDGVVAAYRLPKATDAERDARKASIQAALQRATDAPLNVMRLTAAAIEQGAAVDANGHIAAAGEVGVGLALLRAARDGARMCVEFNLHDTKDDVYRAHVVAEMASLLKP